MQDRTISIILAGGVGSRLHPLTAERAKPAVPFGGNYRIIDFALSNCLHSGMRRVLVLTQYKSHSLHKHLRDGWSVFNPGIGEYVTIVPPQMRTGQSWYSGTADAVSQNLYLLKRSGADQVLILSGDHIYRMDYAAMLKFHCDNLADATVACMKVPIKEASSFGVLAVDEVSRVTQFQEKPRRPRCMPGHPNHALASMGVYIFSCDLLCSVLEEDAARQDSSHDFGKDILPQLIRSESVYGYEFGGERGRVSADGYWRDVGTIDAYYAANMDLLEAEPPIDLYQSNWSIHSAESSLPPARVVPGRSGRHASTIDNAILGSGTVVEGGTVKRSVLSRNVRIAEGAKVIDCILFDDVQIGAGAHLERCIVDKHVNVPPGERIGLDNFRDKQRFVLSDDGIVAVPRSYDFNSLSVPTKPKRHFEPPTLPRDTRMANGLSRS